MLAKMNLRQRNSLRHELDLTVFSHDFHLSIYVLFILIKYCFSVSPPQDINVPLTMPVAKTAFNIENIIWNLIAVNAFLIS